MSGNPLFLFDKNTAPGQVIAFHPRNLTATSNVGELLDWMAILQLICLLAISACRAPCFGIDGF